MRPLTKSEETVLVALRAGIGQRIVREQLADDPERGLWVSFDVEGRPMPRQVPVGWLAQKVEAGQSAEAVVELYTIGPQPNIGPPPDAIIPCFTRVDPVTLSEHQRLLKMEGRIGCVLGYLLGLAMGVLIGALWLR